MTSSKKPNTWFVDGEIWEGDDIKKLSESLKTLKAWARVSGLGVEAVLTRLRWDEDKVAIVQSVLGVPVSFAGEKFPYRDNRMTMALSIGQPDDAWTRKAQMSGLCYPTIHVERGEDLGREF